MSFVSTELIKRMAAYFGNDVKRINHALKVYAFAKMIGESEKISEEEMLILEAAAILHDIGIKVSEEKYGSSSGKYQEIEGPKVAASLMKDLEFSKKVYERILFLIGHHHTYSKIDNIDFQILVEADFLVNIYEDRIDKQQVYIIKNKYFKTDTGMELIERMYLCKGTSGT